MELKRVFYLRALPCNTITRDVVWTEFDVLIRTNGEISLQCEFFCGTPSLGLVLSLACNGKGCN